MKLSVVPFKLSPLSDAQGASTSEPEDFDDAADDALVAEGEEELGDEDHEEAESEDEEEQSDEDQDDLEEEEEVESEEKEVAATGFKFKDPKTGDFDFKRINQAVGGPELEKAFKEQTATITRTSQENKALRAQVEGPDAKLRQSKAVFFDDLMARSPVVKKEVMRILNGGHPEQDPQAAGGFEIPGLNPEDPVAPVLQQLYSSQQAILARLQDSDRQRSQMEQEQKFVNGLRAARARFKELTGAEASDEQMQLIAEEMNNSGLLDGAKFVPSLFLDLIQKFEARKFLEKRKIKQALPKTGALSKRAPVAKGKRRSREDEFNDLWEKHMNGGDE